MTTTCNARAITDSNHNKLQLTSDVPPTQTSSKPDCKGYKLEKMIEYA